MFRKKLQEIKEALGWPELRFVWFLLLLLFAAFVLGARGLDPFLRGVQGGILSLAGVVVFVGLYRAASTDRRNIIERNEFQNILYGLDDALIVYDQNFRIIFFNPAAERLFRLDKGLVVGKEIKPQDAGKPAWKFLVQVLFPSLAPQVAIRSSAGEYPQVADLSFQGPNVDLRVTTSPIADEKGGVFGFIKIIRNRTRELALLHSKGEFLTVASHQLRTPATDINWALQSLKEEAGLSENGRAILESAAAAGRSLLKVIEDLLNVARMEEGRFGYAFEETDISDFVGEILGKISTLASRAGVKIYFDKPKKILPTILIDQARLSVALNNILENSVRYNVENGEVMVKIEEMGSEPFVRVSIKDTGIGISKEEAQKLFSKFFRGEKALKTVTEGSGLGLYIAKNIIQAHGGRIWVESEEGRGTAIYFTLPTDPSLVPKKEVAAEE